MPERILHLKKHAEFVRVASSNQKKVFPAFILQVSLKTDFFKKSENKVFCRIGYTVSRKVGGAVERNRVKRKLRHAFNALCYDYALPKCDYVLIGRRAAIKIPFAVIVKNMEKALIEIGRELNQNEMVM